MAILAVFIAAILALMVPRVQRVAQQWGNDPRRLWVLPVTLSSMFCIAAASSAVLTPALAGLILAYSCAPTLCIGLQRRDAPSGTTLDFVAIMLLWFPLEFAAGAGLVPQAARAYLHTVAYGVAITLGLALFLCYRRIGGMKYSLPYAAADVKNAVIGFALTAPALIALGIWIDFIKPFHASSATGSTMLLAVPIVLLGTALPEEILFRSLIQNLLYARFGRTLRVLLVASVIFGAAHLDNGPQTAPNWRYFILATIAGFAYGKVFDRSSSVWASMLLHTMVDWTKHYYF